MTTKNAEEQFKKYILQTLSEVKKGGYYFSFIEDEKFNLYFEKWQKGELTKEDIIQHIKHLNIKTPSANLGFPLITCGVLVVITLILTILLMFYTLGNLT